MRCVALDPPTEWDNVVSWADPSKLAPIVDLLSSAFSLTSLRITHMGIDLFVDQVKNIIEKLPVSEIHTSCFTDVHDVDVIVNFMVNCCSSRPTEFVITADLHRQMEVSALGQDCRYYGSGESDTGRLYMRLQ